jgi:hypothetical protein
MNEEVDNNEDLWGAIDIENLQQIPYMKNKTAVETDVAEGRAVFYIEDWVDMHYPIELDLPLKAYQMDSETGEKSLVVIIQAENVDGEGLIGVRYLKGGNGICSLSEIEFLTD